MKVYSIAAAAFALVGLVAAYPTGHPTYYKYGGKYHNSNGKVIERVDIEISTVFFFDGQYHDRNGRVIEEVDIQIDATIIIEEDSNDRHHGHSKRGGHPTYYKYDGRYHNSNGEVIVNVEIDINTVFFFDGKYHDRNGRVIEEVDIQIDATIIIEDDNSNSDRHYGHSHSKRDGRQVYYKHDNKYYNSDDFNSNDIVVDVQINIDTVFFFDGQYHDHNGNVIEEVDIQIDATIIIEDDSYDNSRHHGHGHGHSKRDGHQVYYKHNNKYYNSDDFNSDDIVVDVQIEINTVFFFDGQYHDHNGNVIEEVDIQIDATIIIEDDSYDNSRHHGHGYGYGSN